MEKTNIYTPEEQQEINELLAYWEAKDKGEIYKKEKEKFNGKLTPEETLYLMQHGVTTSQIMEIEQFLEKYKDALTGFTDVVGDDKIPTEQFYFNVKHIAHLLDNDPDVAMNYFSFKTKQFTTAKLVKVVAQKFMASEQVFESKNKMLLSREDWLNNKPVKKDSKIILPKEPVLWISNHHFKDDALAGVRAAKRPVAIVFGSIPLYFNTTDGILADFMNSLIMNRKSENSRHATPDKIQRAIDYKSDILWYVEGVHNKTPNGITLEFWERFYDVAVENHLKVMTITNFIKDPTQKIPKEENQIHTIVDGPFDLTHFSKKEGVHFIRNVINSWWYLMAEKFGNTTREELLTYYQQRAIEEYGANEKDFVNRPITSHEAFEIYLRDYKTTVNGYDSTIEAGPADFRSKEIIRPEDVFEQIANLRIVSSRQIENLRTVSPDEVYSILNNANPNTIKNVWNNVEASTLVRTRKLEDYQRRF